MCAMLGHPVWVQREADMGAQVPAEPVSPISLKKWA